MATLLVNNGGYDSLLTVPQSLDEIEQMAKQATDGLVLTYTPMARPGGTDATCTYNKEKNRTEFNGGRIYVGLGAPLGWELNASRYKVIL